MPDNNKEHFWIPENEVHKVDKVRYWWNNENTN